MTYNTSATDAFDDHLLKDREISLGDIEYEIQSSAGLRQEDGKMSSPTRRRSVASSDGIKAFMMNFAAFSRNKDVAPATGDFIKASSFLFRK
ncbi:MAG TPA: hypothetical protein VJ019_03895 [Aestuariivirga sp.]|jgi:hypothetical protein|nr:hypothetical protein [Aestuariivirga sp.]